MLVDGSKEYAHCSLCLYEEQYNVEMTEREREELWVELYDSDASDQEAGRNWLPNMTHLFWRYSMTFLPFELLANITVFDMMIGNEFVYF